MLIKIFSFIYRISLIQINIPSISFFENVIRYNFLVELILSSFNPFHFLFLNINMRTSNLNFEIWPRKAPAASFWIDCNLPRICK